MDPMIPLMTGWLAGVTMREAGDGFRAMKVEAEPPDCFVITFASGLRIRVKCEVVDEPPPVA